MASLLLAAVVPASIAAKDYWVAPDALPAPEQSPPGLSARQTPPPACSQAIPCALQPSLLARLRPGDALHLGSGDYPPLLIRKVHGSEEAPITISAMPRSVTRDATIGMLPAITATHAGATILESGNTRDTFEIQRSSHLLIDGITVKGAIRAGIRINNSHHIRLQRVTVDKAGKWGIFSDYSNALEIADSKITGSGTQHGIYLANSGDEALITRTFIRGFAGSGIHVNGDLSMGGASGVRADGVISNLVFTDNWIDQIGQSGGAGINLDGAINVLIRHNLITNTRSAGVTVFKGDGAIGSDRIKIDSNLIVGDEQSRDLLIFNQSGSNNWVSRNVLVVRDKKSHVLSVHKENSAIAIDAPQTLPFQSRANLFWSAGAVVDLRETSLSRAGVAKENSLGLQPAGAYLGAPLVTTSQSGYLLSTALRKLATLHEISRSNPYLTATRIGVP